MKSPTFNDRNVDEINFAPFKLINCLNTEWKDMRLSFHDWSWIAAKYEADTVNGYYLNGYGVEGLVKATLCDAGIDFETEDIHFNSEGDACFIHFKDLQLAVRTAELASNMISNPTILRKMIGIARKKGFED